MRFRTEGHRFALELLTNSDFSEWKELLAVIEGISDDDIRFTHNKLPRGVKKSPSEAINRLFHERLVRLGWSPQARIFKEKGYTDHTWKLDFAKGEISLEVAFNNAGSVAWNLIKPCLASELNHIEKDVRTRIGVIITATNALKRSGGFDGAIGSFERYVEYLKPLGALLATPILIIGLEPMEKYRVRHRMAAGRKQGVFVRLSTEDEQPGCPSDSVRVSR